MSKILKARPKLFGQLDLGDSIYYISPITHEIEGYKIKTIQGFSNEEIKQAPKLKHQVKIVVFHNVMALQSPDLDKIPTLTFVFDGRVAAQMAIVKVGFSETHQPKMPVPFFANIDKAKEWKNV